jgi:hypothetical protein
VQRGVELDSAGSRGIHQGGRTARPRSRYS